LPVPCQLGTSGHHTIVYDAVGTIIAGSAKSRIVIARLRDKETAAKISQHVGNLYSALGQAKLHPGIAMIEGLRNIG